MSKLCFAIIAVLALSGGGCAIHPTPDDVTPLDTYAIVAQVRCEVRQALRAYIDIALRKRPEDAHLAEDLLNGAISYDQLLGKIRNPDLKGVFLQYAAATIGYDFSLDMTEANNVSGNATLTRPFVRGADTIGFTIGSGHKRENTRTFTIDDTFVKLLTADLVAYCANTADTPNYNYPITGKTRLSDTVGTFLDLNQSGNLGMKKGGPKTPTLTDDLQFTTSYAGSIAPGFTYTPVGRIFAWTGVGGKIENSRSDLHRVTVALAMPEKGTKSTAKALEESRQEVRNALANANNNRFQVNLQKISSGLNNFTASAPFFGFLQ